MIALFSQKNFLLCILILLSTDSFLSDANFWAMRTLFIVLHLTTSALKWVPYILADVATFFLVRIHTCLGPYFPQIQ